MDIIISSKHKAFCDYIASLLSKEKDVVNFVDTADECIERLSKRHNAVIILDAHSEKPYSSCSAICCLDKFWRQGLNNPVVILGWFEEDYLKHTLSADISRYFCAFYKDSYKYLLLPDEKKLLQTYIQSIKPLNRKSHE